MPKYIYFFRVEPYRCPLADMAGKMTRKTLTDFLEQCKDDICIIPSHILGEFLQGMKDREAKFLESTEKMCQTQNRLCDALDRIAIKR